MAKRKRTFGGYGRKENYVLRGIAEERAKKSWLSEIPIVGDLLAGEDMPTQYNYPREPVEAEQGIITPQNAVIAAALALGIYVVLSRR